MDFSSKEFFIELDVHKRRWIVSIFEGIENSNFTQPPEAESPDAFIAVTAHLNCVVKKVSKKGL